MKETQPVIKKQRKKKKSTNEELVSWDYNPPTFFYERLTPWPDARISHFCREMVAWAKQPTSLVFSRFFSDRKPPMIMADVYKKMEIHPELKDTVGLVKQILGGRREQAGLEWKLNFQALRETQPLYDPEYRALKAEWIKSTADHIERIVIMPQIPVPKAGNEKD